MKARQHRNNSINKRITALKWQCGFDYFVLHDTQEDIRERYKLSRPTVVRYIQDTRDLFTLTPDFAAAPNLTANLEARLRHLYDLKKVIVVPLWVEDYTLVTRLLGRAAALTFTEFVRKVYTNDKRKVNVAVAGGETMLYLTLALQPLNIPMNIFPLVVGPHPDTALSAGAIAGIMARQLSDPRKAEVLVSPFLHFSRVSFNEKSGYPSGGSSITTADKQLDIQAYLDKVTLNEARKADIVLVGIGSLKHGTTLSHLIKSSGSNIRNWLEREFNLEKLEELGLICEIASQFLLPKLSLSSNSEKQSEAYSLAKDYNATVTGIRLEDLVQLSASDKYIVAVAGGKDQKFDAIYHALTCKDKDGNSFRPFNVLITDVFTAEALIEIQERTKG